MRKPGKMAVDQYFVPQTLSNTLGVEILQGQRNKGCNGGLFQPMCLTIQWFKFWRGGSHSLETIQCENNNARPKKIID
jgi:hypothetical protein